ncbi:endolytic transglycosylase MltG, partial [Anaerospora hongkongensis]
MNNIQKKALLQIFVLVLVLMVITGFEYWRDSGVMVSTYEGRTETLTVKPEMTVKDIGEVLFQNGIIHNATLFRINAKVQGAENSLQAGNYVLSSKMSMSDIIDKMVRGDTVYRLLTIPEGYNVEQIAKLLDEQGLGDGATFKALARNFTPLDYMVQQPGIIYPVEGYVFPDTYRINPGMTEEGILKMLVANFDKKLTTDMRERAR